MNVKGEIVMLEQLKTEAFDQVYRIMEQSFPPDEYRPYQEQSALLENPRYTIYVCPDSQTAQVKAFASVWQLEAWFYVEHFAVDPACRNEGLGAAMLQELCACLPGRIYLEVERPDCELARRRIGFYQRNGFFLNEYPYIQPPISTGRSAIPLLIMTTGGVISEKTFQQLRQLLYRHVYRVAPEKIDPYALE